MSRARNNRDSEMLVSPGARNRSVFELSESGASKALQDSVQFHLDGLFTLKSSKPRMLCAFKLIELCTSSKHVLPAFRSNGIAATLLRVVGLLASESDHSFRLCLQALALILCQSDKGEIILGIDMPRNVFISLLSSVQHQQLLPITPSAPSGPENESASQSSTVEDAPIKLNSIHRKRKFAGKKVPVTASIGNASENDAPFKKKILLNRTSDEDETEHSTSVFPNDDGLQELINNLQVLWPSFSAFCGFQSLLADRNVAGIGQLIALTVVSRYLMSLVQHDAQSQSQSCTLIDRDNLNSSENMNEKKGSKGESKKAERNDVVLLGEYQSLLRIPLPEQMRSFSNHVTHGNSDQNVPKQLNCFLSITINEIGQDIISVLDFLEQTKNIPKNLPKNILPRTAKNNAEHSLRSLGRPRINRIYQVLCLLDASCFKCSENQVRTVHLYMLYIYIRSFLLCEAL